MAPDSLALEVLAVIAAVLATAGLALIWNRGRILLRGGALLACPVTMAVAGLVWVNRQVDTYPTWSSLAGGTDTAVAAPAGPAGPSATSGGRIITFTAKGRTGISLPVYAYLPAAYATEPGLRFPVVEALHGYPGSPLFWQTKLHVVATLDREIAAGRMAPTVVLFPYQTPDPLLDTECTDLAHGPQMETYLTVDVPAAAKAQLRVRPDPGSWGLIGFSAGGYCATDLLLRHPGQYAAGASLSGYADPGIKVGDGTEHTTYNDAWRLQHLPIPAVALYLACARTDRAALHGTAALAKLAKSPISVTTAYVNGGGHNAQTWTAMEAPAFDWLSTWLGRPVNAA
jgi:enterochelin esterase-like enzyme